jgi:transposase-like protein
VKINGEMHYLWRAVDHEGEVLESVASKTRDKPAALKFMKKLMKRHGRAKVITTDGLRSYKAAMKSSATPRNRRSDAGLTTGSKTRTCPSDDESERC